MGNLLSVILAQASQTLPETVSLEVQVNTIVSASILGADICHLGEALDKLRTWQIDMVHFDVMDGVFVPNISFGIPMLSAVRRHTKLFLDVHLMITDPLRYVSAFAKAGADRITFHLESSSDPRATLEAIRQTGRQAGIAIKPGTPVEDVIPYLSLADMVDGAQSAVQNLGNVGHNETASARWYVRGDQEGEYNLTDTTEKVRQLRRDYPKLCIQVDGGINDQTAPIARQAGANELVTGSYLFQAADPFRAAALLRGDDSSLQAG